jgi:hypothetical protein
LNNTTNPPKRIKANRVNIIKKITNSIGVLAIVFSQQGISEVKDIIDLIIESQVQIKIQNKTCLTDIRLIFIIDRLADTKLARSYMALKLDKIRVTWIRKEIQ